MITIVIFGDLWVNKVSISYLQQSDLENKNKTDVQSDYTNLALMG